VNTTLLILAVLFLATFIRSALGFGEALIAVPLLALTLPVQVAAPLAVLVSITVATVVVIQDWRNIHIRTAGWLIVSTLFGIPLGLLMLKTVPEAIIKGMLGVFIIAFAVYSLTGRTHRELHNDRLAPLFGFSAGILGGAYGMNGPPLVIYGVLRRWKPAQFRATLQGYFLIASIVGMAGYAFTGLWTGTVSRYFLLSLPLALIATMLGGVVHRRLSGPRFLIAVNVGLAVIGVVLFAQALKNPGVEAQLHKLRQLPDTCQGRATAGSAIRRRYSSVRGWNDADHRSSPNFGW
jgi:uncharacterized protein